jgi:hypothetical protein
MNQLQHECRTCKFWQLHTAGYVAKPLGDCSSPAFLRSYHVTDEELTPASVVVENDEGWGFYTGPEFGCVHWEPADGQ